MGVCRRPKNVAAPETQIAQGAVDPKNTHPPNKGYYAEFGPCGRGPVDL